MSVEKAAPDKQKRLDELFDDVYIQLFREHPFQKSPDFVAAINRIIDNKEFKDIFNFIN